MLKSAVRPVKNFVDMADKAAEAAELLGAMAQKTRLLILCNLVANEKSVSDLVEICGISQSTVSQHLAKMRALKLVATRREGQTIFYRLASNEARLLLTTLYKIYCA